MKGWYCASAGLGKGKQRWRRRKTRQTGQACCNEVRMHMSNGRKVERYAYRKVDESLLATPAGEFATK